MSVLIKDMEMPKNCYACMTSGFRSAIKCEEWSLISSGLFREMRSASCPLVELPEKHGRLIDADFVTEKANHEAKAMDEPLKSNFDGLVEWIVDKTPTVIEAEGSEDS